MQKISTKGIARMGMPNKLPFFFFFANDKTKNVFFPLVAGRFCYHATAPRDPLLFSINERMLWT